MTEVATDTGRAKTGQGRANTERGEKGQTLAVGKGDTVRGTYRVQKEVK